jgi:hypothetical protein
MDELVDGFVYAIKWLDNSNESAYKIGRTQMLGTESSTIDKLISRYWTYSLNGIEIYYKRVANQIFAEKYLHESLSNYRCKSNKEFFKCSEEEMIASFEEVAKLYPSINYVICLHTPEELTQINKTLREKPESKITISFTK